MERKHRLNFLQKKLELLMLTATQQSEFFLTLTTKMLRSVKLVETEEKVSDRQFVVWLCHLVNIHMEVVRLKVLSDTLLKILGEMLKELRQEERRTDLLR